MSSVWCWGSKGGSKEQRKDGNPRTFGCSPELAGSIVSIDAIACQPHIAEQIRNKKADYAGTEKEPRCFV
ncbi:MAG: transposase [Sphingobacteriales bacterium]|nr:transposase [Sphingobacteriales bacterium]